MRPQVPMNFTPDVKLLFGLFVAMTLASFGGPVLVGFTLWGGDSPNWPPDRPIEWVVVIGTGLTVLILMLAILVIGAKHKMVTPKDKSPTPQTPDLAKTDNHV